LTWVGWLGFSSGNRSTSRAVGAALVVAFLVMRASAFGASRQPRMLLVGARGWLLYAAWEWLVMTKTPEADIRVDLLVIWPVLAFLSMWALFRAVR
jgi:hypothetical protein